MFVENVRYGVREAAPFERYLIQYIPSSSGPYMVSAELSTILGTGTILGNSCLVVLRTDI